MKKVNRKFFYIYIGTTAEYIKVIPLILQLQKKNSQFRIVTSGQTDIKFNEFQAFTGVIVPYKTFDHKNTRSSLSSFLLWSFKTAFSTYKWLNIESENKRVKSVIIHGDTVTALIGAFCSKLAGCKLYHIESGLRSKNYLHPFPEEICRVLISFFADIHFCPTKNAIKNIEKKGGRKVNTFQNTGIEMLHIALQYKHKKPMVKFAEGKKYFIFIVHRQEHVFFWKDVTKKLIELVIKSAKNDLVCLFIVHDVTINFLKSVGMWDTISKNKNIKIMPRLSYLEYVNVLKKAEYIVTDGGGNHVESYYLGLPCLILRKTTEQTEGVGENVVISKEDPIIIENFLDNYKKHKKKQIKIKTWPSEIIYEEIAK